MFEVRDSEGRGLMIRLGNPLGRAIILLKGIDFQSCRRGGLKQYGLRREISFNNLVLSNWVHWVVFSRCAYGLNSQGHLSIY